MFGAPAAGGGLFGAAPAAGGMFGAAQATGGGMFGAAPAAGGGMFGAAPAAGGMFGAAPSGGGMFGAAPAAGGMFGAAPSGGGMFGAAPAAGGMFGAAPAAGGMFGAAATGGGMFGGASSSGGGLFGAAPAGGGMFGAAPAGGGMFGAAPSGGGMFGAAASGGGMFGAAASGGGMFGAAPGAGGMFGAGGSSGGMLGAAGGGMFGADAGAGMLGASAYGGMMQVNQQLETQALILELLRRMEELAPVITRASSNPDLAQQVIATLACQHVTCTLIQKMPPASQQQLQGQLQQQNAQLTQALTQQIQMQQQQLQQQGANVSQVKQQIAVATITQLYQGGQQMLQMLVQQLQQMPQLGVSMASVQAELQAIQAQAQVRQSQGFVAYTYTPFSEPPDMRQQMLAQGPFQAQLHIDHAKWEEARQNNPDPSSCYPEPLVGLPALENRISMQTQNMEACSQNLEALKAGFGNLKQSLHAQSYQKLEECRQRHQKLQRQLLQVVAAVETHAVNTGAARRSPYLEAQLEDRFARLEEAVSAPASARARLEELWVVLKGLRQRGPPSGGAARLADADAEKTLRLTASQGELLQLLQEELAQRKRDIEQFEGALKRFTTAAPAAAHGI